MYVSLYIRFLDMISEWSAPDLPHATNNSRGCFGQHDASVENETITRAVMCCAFRPERWYI